MSFRSSKSSHKRSVSRASVSSHNSGSDTTAKLADQLSLNSFSESESPILAAYPSRKQKVSSKLKLFRKSAAPITDDYGNGKKRLNRQSAAGGRRDGIAGLAQQLAQMRDGEIDLQGMTEKGIDQLRADLAAVDADCAEQIRKTMHQNYHHFTQACQGITDLEGDMQAVRTLLGNSSSSVAALREVATPSGAARDTFGEASSSGAHMEWQNSPEGQEWAEALEDLDIAIAERRCGDAVQLLLRADTSAKPEPVDWSDPEHHTRHDRIDAQRAEVEQRRLQLSATLEGQIADPCCTAGARRAAAGLLATAVNKPWAHQKLLDAHSAQLRQQQDALSKPQNTSGEDADGTAFANALGQASFRAVAVAANDATSVFPKEAGELTSLFLVWALQETIRCAQLLKQHALAPFAVPAGLGPTVQCCTLAMLYCSALETTHSLKLSPRLLRELWPTCEQVMHRTARGFADELKRQVGAELDRLANQGVASDGPLTGWDILIQLFPSANHLLGNVESIASMLTPLAGPKVAILLRKTISDLFQTYTSSMSAGFQKHQQPDGSYPYNLDRIVESVMELTSVLGEHQLPAVTAGLTQTCGKVCDTAAVGNCLEALATSLGMQSAA